MATENQEVEVIQVKSPNEEEAASGSKAGLSDSGEEMGMTEDEIVVWHHRLDGHEFE